MSKNNMFLIAGAAIVLACGSIHAGQRQGAEPSSQSSREDREFETAANKWMKVPFDVGSLADSVAPQDRRARDGYWDSQIGAPRPISDPNAQERPQPFADAVVDGPEIFDFDDGVIVIGTFESYRTVLSASQRSVYTEIELRIQHVFGHPKAPMQEGQLIDLDRPGGTILAPWGEARSFAVHPESMGLQPDHTYLIHLGYVASGHFYRGGSYKTGEIWDLTEGTVKPGNSLQKARADQKLSEINGLSVDELIQFLDKKYQENYRK